MKKFEGLEIIDFFEKHKDDYTIQYFHKNIKKIVSFNWFIVARNCEFGSKFLSEFESYFDKYKLWDILTSSYMFSKEELIKYKDKINWDKAAFCQSFNGIDGKFLNDFLSDKDIDWFEFFRSDYISDEIKIDCKNHMNKIIAPLNGFGNDNSSFVLTDHSIELNPNFHF